MQGRPKITKPFDKRGRGLECEGCLYDIFHYFIKPIMKHKHHEDPRDEWLAYILNTHYREIYEMECIRDFEMPGTYYLTATKTVQDWGPRRVLQGDILFIREDSRNYFIDIERADQDNPELDEKVFKVSRDEFKVLQASLKRVFKWWLSDYPRSKPYCLRK